MANLAEALGDEIRRNTELLKMYEEIPTGAFAVALIKAKLEMALKALASGDCESIIYAYEELKDTK